MGAKCCSFSGLSPSFTSLEGPGSGLTQDHLCSGGVTVAACLKGTGPSHCLPSYISVFYVVNRVLTLLYFQVWRRWVGGRLSVCPPAGIPSSCSCPPLSCEGVGLGFAGQGMVGPTHCLRVVCGCPPSSTSTRHTLVMLSPVYLKESRYVRHLYYNIYEILLVTFISSPDPRDMTC